MSDRSQRNRWRLSTRFLVYYALTYLALIGLMGLVIERSARSALIEDVVVDLELGARLASASLPGEQSGEYDDWTGDIFAASGFRTTLIDTDGVVLGDSHSDPAVMENHADRPEVLSAMSGQVGEARRTSSSTGFEQVYVALPRQDGLIVRVSVPTRVIDEQLTAIRSPIIIVASTVGFLGVVVVALLARRMAQPIAKLTEQSRAVAQGNLDVSPRRYSVIELDQLSLAISQMAADIRKRLSESETAIETLEMVLGALPQGTILIDGDNRITYANPPAHQLLGAIPDQLGHLAPHPFQTAVREARQGQRQETRVVDHGKPPRRLRGEATPFADDDRVLLVVMDITDRERTDQVRRDFVANASHELKTPVSTIIASAEALQIGLRRRDPNAISFAEQIEGSARQLDRLVGDLLDLSRLERETPEAARIRFDLVVIDEVERTRPRAEQSGLTLTGQCEVITIMASQRDVTIATRNLLDNAIRYTSEEGTIDVSLRAEAGEAVLRVKDSGEGIPTRDLDRVFERFYRVDSARSRATGGTGLGLAIVKHVAERHGGSVEVDSELGAGSTFTVRLPIAE